MEIRSQVSYRGFCELRVMVLFTLYVSFLAQKLYLSQYGRALSVYKYSQYIMKIYRETISIIHFFLHHLANWYFNRFEWKRLYPMRIPGVSPSVRQR